MKATDNSGATNGFGDCRNDGEGVGRYCERAVNRGVETACCLDFCRNDGEGVGRYWEKAVNRAVEAACCFDFCRDCEEVEPNSEESVE